MSKIPVAVLAATGAVGQRFVQLLADHPWFEIAAVTGSARTAGERYGDNVRWILTEPMPEAVADLIVQPTLPELDAPVVFSALPTAEARELEPQFAGAGYAVITNASAFRMTEDVPLLIPEINPDHTALIPRQQARYGWSGFIVASPNCSTTSAILPMHIFQRAFGLRAALITTLQAISGAGYPGLSALDIVDNVVPHIAGEDEKLENEPRKLLGQIVDGRLAPAELEISAEATRVPVRDGHLAVVSVRLDEPVTPRAAIEALRSWQLPDVAATLPSSPARTLVYREEADRPQPRLDRDSEQGLAWTVGNVRRCPVLDLRYMALTHNTLRGAASGALLNAELLVAQGLIGEPQGSMVTGSV
jgi:aspartate-semialdehyde dehydrogenase